MGGSDWSIRFVSLRGQEKVMKSGVLPEITPAAGHMFPAIPCFNTLIIE